MKSGSRAFGLIFLTLLIDVAAMGMTLPVLPGIIGGFVGGDLARVALFAGIAAALTAGLEFGCAPIIGELSDRFGRKPLLLLGMLGPGLTYLLLAVAPSVAWLLVSAVYTTTNAYVADVTPQEERAARPETRSTGAAQTPRRCCSNWWTTTRLPLPTGRVGAPPLPRSPLPVPR